MNKRDKKQNINAAPAETAPADTAPTAAPIETNAADGAVSANTAPAAAPVETAAAPETAAPQGTPAPRKVFIKPKGAFKAPPKQPAEAFVQSAAPKEPAAPVAEPAPTAKKAEPKTGAAPKKPAPAKESETGAAPKKPAPAKEPETADEIRFRRDLEAVKETFVSEEPITEKLNALLELNRAAGDILLGRLDDAVGELEKVKAAFLDLPADNAEAGELIYYGYGEEVVSSVKSIAVQEFLLTREIVFAENAVIEKAAYAFQLAEAKDGILEGSRGQDARRAAQNISEMSDRISRMRPGSIDRMNAEGHLDRALNSLLQLKIGDFIAFPRVVRSKEPRKTPPPVKAESGYEPLFASKQDKPDVAKAFSRESDKPDRETERRNLKHDEDEIKRTLEAMRGKVQEEEEFKGEIDLTPVRPKSADELDDYVDHLSQNVIAEKWAAQIEALYKRFIGLIDGGETEKRDATVSGLFPTIEKLDRQHARLARLVETVKASMASRKKK